MMWRKPTKGVFSQQDFTKILAFLKSVQTD
jgi:hypothetical protein